MDDLLAAALLGTGKQSGAKALSFPSLDGLAKQLEDVSLERQLLLLAGSRAVYQNAGRKVVTANTSPEPAAPDATPVCSPQAAALFEQFLHQDPIELRIEAIQRLARAGQRLPAELVPQALDERHGRVREILPPVVGTLGKWLSQFNPAWHWLSTTAAQSADTTAEQVWTEGSLEQRKAILARSRASQPDLGRAWLEKAWPKEKAESKLSFLDAFQAGLSLQDESFLEACLDDRSQRVRVVAARMLARLGPAAFAARMVERADALLEFTAHRGEGDKVGKASAGALTVTPPQQFDKAWEREGLLEKPPQRKGNRAYWLEQLLELTPVTHWETKFGRGPEQLMELASASEFAESVLAAWTASALSFGSRNWLPPLWDYWVAGQQALQPDWRTRFLTNILMQMTPDITEARIVKGLNEDNPTVVNALREYTQTHHVTWSEAVGAAYLAGARRAAVHPRASGPVASDFWLIALEAATAALPESCFTRALEPWEMCEVTDDLANMWRRETDKLVDVIGARKRFADAVPLPETEETLRGQKQK
jgi:hypothetical protein